MFISHKKKLRVGLGGKTNLGSIIGVKLDLELVLDHHDNPILGLNGSNIYFYECEL